MSNYAVTYADGPVPSNSQLFAPKYRKSRPIYPFKGVEVAAGVVQYQSAFNCAAVAQPDGIILFEGVVSSDYTAAILADVAKRFPGKSVKAVISTDDACGPTSAGLRPFAARAVPIYAAKPNEAILRRLFKAPHTLYPDELQRSSKSAIVKAVDSPTTVGTGANETVIYPVHGSVAERMLYVYFPGRKSSVYAPDVIQRDGDKWFNLNLLDEFLRAVKRDGLQPTTAFAFHSGPVAYDELEAAVAAAKAK